MTRSLIASARETDRPRRSPPGSPPGRVAPHPSAPRPRIHATVYSATTHQEIRVESVSQLPAVGDPGTVVWVDVQGLGNAKKLLALGEHFGIHRLALEDVVNTHQRSKLEPYEDHYFVVMRMPLEEDPLHTEQLSIFLGRGFVLTFQEFPGECLEPVRKRLRDTNNRIRREGADYLAYRIMDTVLDAYFPRLDEISDALDELESEHFVRPNVATPQRLHTLRRELLTIRRAVSPFREAVNSLIRDTGDEISDYTRLHLRDCHDHTYQILDMVDTQREIASGLLDVHLSLVSNRMNEIMKVLTIIATLFIPLTFVAGVYGMNFDPDASAWNMPELRMSFGYPVIILVMLAIIAVELYAFWRLGWLGKSRS